MKQYPEIPEHSITEELYLRDDVYNIPPIIQAIYRETLSAVQRDLPTLAGIGIRSIIEVTCKELKAKKWNLEEKIDELKSKSLLTQAGAKILHRIRTLGNNATHKNMIPQKKQILAALKVIDHLLLGVYVLPKEALILPKRKPKTRKNKKNVNTGKPTVASKVNSN